MTWFLWGMVAGALLVNLRYYLLFRKRGFKLEQLVRHWPKDTHFRGITSADRKFVFCPVSRICSWSPGDYDHEWCHACQIFFSDHAAQLLSPEERKAYKI